MPSIAWVIGWSFPPAHITKATYMFTQLALEFIRAESVPTLGAIMLALIAIVTAGHRE